MLRPDGPRPNEHLMLHRFEIGLADVDRGVYEDLDLRVARHPSEDVPYLLTRVLAFAFECKPGLAFSNGLCAGSEPALWVRTADGRVLDWIEVGAPAPDRLHRAAKLAERVAVYCHRRPDLLRQRCAKERVHGVDRIKVVEVGAAVLADLGERLERNNRWDLSVHEGRTTIVCDGHVIEASFPSAPLGERS